MTYTLYYAPGACSISPNIALREAGLPFELVKVDTRTKKLANGDDYLAVVPKGYVPALRLPDGTLLTEGAVMVQYIADQVPDKRLAPALGTTERYRLMEWLNFIATELHKGTSPLYSPLASKEYKDALKERLAKRWEVLAAGVKGTYLTGNMFTVADGYAFYVMRSWQRAHEQSLTPWPTLVDYYARLAERASVQAALASESLSA